MFDKIRGKSRRMRLKCPSGMISTNEDAPPIKSHLRTMEHGFLIKVDLSCCMLQRNIAVPRRSGCTPKAEK